MVRDYALWLGFQMFLNKLVNLYLVGIFSDGLAKEKLGAFYAFDGVREYRMRVYPPLRNLPSSTEANSARSKALFLLKIKNKTRMKNKN